MRSVKSGSRTRIENAFSQTEDGTANVEAGYCRLADAAMRISIRQGKSAAPPPKEEPEVFVDDGVETDKKRPRVTPTDGSVMGSAPGTDEGSRGVVSDEHATKAAPSQPKPTVQEPRGLKRAGNGNDDERGDDVAAREEVYEDDDSMLANAPTSIATAPTQATEGGMIDNVHSTKGYAAAEGRMTESMARTGRNRDMEVVREKLGCKVDVGEIYTPPRVCKMAESFGLRPGFSLDFTAPRMNWRRWEFSLPSRRREALKFINDLKPHCVIGSPPCTA